MGGPDFFARIFFPLLTLIMGKGSIASVSPSAGAFLVEEPHPYLFFGFLHNRSGSSLPISLHYQFFFPSIDPIASLLLIRVRLVRLLPRPPPRRLNCVHK